METTLHHIGSQMTDNSQIREYLKSSQDREDIQEITHLRHKDTPGEYLKSSQDREDIQEITHLRHKDTPGKLYKKVPNFLKEVGSLIYTRNCHFIH